MKLSELIKQLTGDAVVTRLMLKPGLGRLTPVKCLANRTAVERINHAVNGRHTTILKIITKIDGQPLELSWHVIESADNGTVTRHMPIDHSLLSAWLLENNQPRLAEMLDEWHSDPQLKSGIVDGELF